MCGLLQGMPRAASVLIDMNRTPIVSSEQKITKTATATSREVLCIQKVYKHCDMSEAEYWVLLASVVRPAVSKEPIYTVIVGVSFRRYYASMIEIVRLDGAEQRTLDEINKLLSALSERIPACTPDLLQRIVGNPTVEIWVAKHEGHIVGMGELALVLKLEGISAYIEDVVVAIPERGKGIGTLIMKKLIERARVHGAQEIHLTSRPDRVAANKLYKKLGFEMRATNAYCLKL